MEFINTAMYLLLQSGETEPSPSNVGFELEIWKWVVAIGVGAFIVFFVMKRVADVAAKKKTASIIENVVGAQEAQEAGDWQEESEDSEDK